MAADPGTATTIHAGATLELTGDGGYYRGSAAGQPSVLTNNGVLRKSGGTGTSVVDATYPGSGQVACRPGPSPCPTASRSARPSRPGPGWPPGGAAARSTAVAVPADAKTRPRTP